MIDLINNEADAKKLAELLSAYTKRHTGSDLSYIDIVKAFNKLKPYGNHGSRLFAALVDLKTNLCLLLLDNFISGALWNEQVTTKMPEGESILNNPILFDKRLEIHRHNANYIPRYRAMWDKIMGIILLISSEEKYDKYNSAKSRKRAFKLLSVDVSFLNKDFANNITEHIQLFDDNFRTPEVHRFGALRKYSFLHAPFEKTEYIQLRSSWNYILSVLQEIDKLIEAIE